MLSFYSLASLRRTVSNKGRVETVENKKGTSYCSKLLPQKYNQRCYKNVYFVNMHVVYTPTTNNFYSQEVLDNIDNGNTLIITKRTIKFGEVI